MNKLLMVFIFCISIQVKSQDNHCENKLSPASILICINTNSNLSEKDKIRKIINYSSNHKLKDYKRNNYYSVFEYNESNHLVISKSYRDRELSHETHRYYDNDNNLIRYISYDYDSTLMGSSDYGITWKQREMKYTYSNGLLIERAGYGDGEFFKRYNYEYNSQNQLSKTYCTDNERSVLIKKTSYNNNDLIDTVYYYAFIGNNQSCQVFKYDSLNNVVEEKQIENNKDIRILNTNYVYDDKERIIEKIVDDNDNSSYHWMYEYKKNSKKEEYTEYHNDTIYSTRKSQYHYDENNNLILETIESKTTNGQLEVSFKKYNYNEDMKLIEYAENSWDKRKSFFIYEY
jgi:hypothetical protein